MNDLAFYDAHETKLDFMMIDLGVSRHVDVSQHQRLITKYPRKGNPPEAKLGQYTPGSDVWTVGAIAYHLLSHDSSPSPLIDREVPLETILKGFRQNKSISREARDFVVRCLRLDTTQRMDSRDLLDHVWFQKTSTRNQDHHRVHDMITSDQAYFQRTVRKFQDHAEKIRRHDRDSAFKRVANRFIAYHVPRNIQQDYRDLYARFDDDFLGTLSSDEFHGVLSEHIPNVQHLRQLFEYMDANQSGFIEYDEFLGHLVGYEENHESQVLMEAFHTLDVDNDGLITASDLSRRLDQDVVVCASMIDEVVPRLEGEGSQLNMYQFIELFKLFGRRELMLSMKNGLSNSFTSFSDSFRSLRNNLLAVRHKSTVGE